MSLTKKNVVLAIQDNVYQYKIFELIQLLQQSGCNLKIILGDKAQQSITPGALHNAFDVDIFTEQLSLAKDIAITNSKLVTWLELLLIVPATMQNVIKIGSDIADDLLSTICLANTAKIFLVPNLSFETWQQKYLMQNITKLKQHNVMVLKPESQLYDILTPKDITAKLILLQNKQHNLLIDKHVLITAGPTQEPIDNYTAITSYNNGKMGYALATAAKSMGATVTLISGPTELAAPKGVTIIKTKTFHDMQQEIIKKIIHADICITAAEPCKYKPTTVNRNGLSMSIVLNTNQDINSLIPSLNSKPFLAAFYYDVEIMLDEMKQQLQNKSLNMIIVNCNSTEDHTESYLITKSGHRFYNRQNKQELAYAVLQQITKNYVDVSEALPQL